MQIEIAGWLLDIDVERTKTTYAEIKHGGCQQCRCIYCINFLAAIPTAFPQEILNFFKQSGINISKDAEIYEYGEVSPGILHYGGDYHLWGKIIKEPSQEIKLPNEFLIAFIQPSALFQKEFNFEGALSFNFTGYIPWVLTSTN